MCHDGLHLDGAKVPSLVRHVLDEHSGHILLLRLVDERRATASSYGHSRVGGSDGRVDRVGAVVQLGQRLGKVLGVDQLIRSILEAHLPAVRWRGRRRDEEQLAGIREREVLVTSLDGCRLSEIDLDLLAHNELGVPGLSNGDSGVNVEEGDEDAAEGLERRECVDGSGLGNQVADRRNVLGEEDVGVDEVGEEQRV